MPQWRKPSGRCSLHVDDQCVEVTGGLVPNQVAVRDSKNPDVSLIFTRPEFAAFAHAIKAGEYDDLIDVPATA